MDRFKRAIDIIKSYNIYKDGGSEPNFVRDVCDYFDFIKNRPLNEADLNILYFLANQSGIPHYYDLLRSKYGENEISADNMSLMTMGAAVYNASLQSGDTTLHRYQKEVIESFEIGKTNRYILTAPTSFGKTHLVYEIINKLRYKNVLLVFPTISLLSENFSKLHGRYGAGHYSIHTLSEENVDFAKNNIFIFTPERYLSFIDKHQSCKFDFAFLDEVYKIDNTFILDGESVEENERDTAYRIALEYICRSSRDILLAGPYITIREASETQRFSFNCFLSDNNLSILSYNDYEIVSKKYDTLKSAKSYVINDKKVEVGSCGNGQKIANIICALCSNTENAIVYCARRQDAESYANKIVNNAEAVRILSERSSHANQEYFDAFLEHIKREYGEDWILYKALNSKIGIHHGLIPKYIQKEVINFFNNGNLICLFSTTTITEGVNTSAKYMIITSCKKGLKALRHFDAKNIAGRAGRFMHHYSGNVIALNNNFEEVATSTPDVLQHKNYDVLSEKTDVDYQITNDKYLSEDDRQNREYIRTKVLQLNIPQDVFSPFPVISPASKLLLYEKVQGLSPAEIEEVHSISVSLMRSRLRFLNVKGFQIILDCILPMVTEKKFRNLITLRVADDEFSLVTMSLKYYLRDGFRGMVAYYVGKGDKKDAAVRKAADFVYNVFKYNLSKYIGVFDLFYRHRVSQEENKPLQDVPGLSMLLHKLEYNALSPLARKISDYGVPFKLIDCYDSNPPYRKDGFDTYEKLVDDKVSLLFT